ncbi:adenosylcobinamide-GDP ribazoletransferase [Pseudomonas oryzihabitans]|uniref:adenosylcobinamide-GDP ribazoletransferase n=1 Tax=Pseudomonas oryzihabitans TaxID=47885 RepID=UPI0012399BF4|nr:adenosylcobinamide-GDP ribazoletransferase [Pseudomonas oryzihabitans]QEU02562.1 adenosylcobinamide-GDP ribazoletransferase [Pseudomonas oryzihabitans]HJE68269.1 adenosylcobinamide-GDP ribazoletransferase [Pseudomonas oryzihabitans]
MPLPLLIAVQFLTRLPVRLPGMPPAAAVGRSVLWYPAVGLLLGALLSLIAWLGASGGVLLQAALVLAGWVILTGGLHLDGLADTADAWIGGYGDRERTLAIMKDPACGPMGVLALLLTLLLKWSALVVLLPHAPAALWLAPLAGRLALPWLLLTTAYVRPGGLGELLSRHLPRKVLVRVLLLGALGMVLLPQGLAALLVTAGIALLVRRALRQRLGGTTGDTAGALLEIVEAGVLVALALTLG